MNLLSRPNHLLDDFHLNGTLERHIFTKISSQMITKGGLINTLVVIALAKIVEHALSQKTHQIHQYKDSYKGSADDDLGRDAEAEAALLRRTLDDEGAKSPPNKTACGEVAGDEDGGHACPSAKQLPGFPNGLKATDRLEHRHDRSDVPEGGDEDMAGEEGGKEEGEDEEENGGIRTGEGDEEDDEARGEGEVVEDHEEGDPEEGAEEAGEDRADGVDGVGEGDGLGGVEGGDSEYDGGGGEERESEEEEHVDELVEEEEGPGGGGGRGSWGLLEVEEDGVGEEGVDEDGEGEGEDESEGEDRESAGSGARDRRRFPENVGGAEGLEFLQLEIHREDEQPGEIGRAHV